MKLSLSPSLPLIHIHPYPITLPPALLQGEHISSHICLGVCGTRSLPFSFPPIGPLIHHGSTDTRVRVSACYTVCVCLCNIRPMTGSSSLFLSSFYPMIFIQIYAY